MAINVNFPFFSPQKDSKGSHYYFAMPSENGSKWKKIASDYTINPSHNVQNSRHPCELQSTILSNLSHNERSPTQNYFDLIKNLDYHDEFPCVPVDLFGFHICP